LNPKEWNVAKALRARGYATGCVGKWHLGDQPEFLPTRQGFDSYYGLPYSNDMRPTPKPQGPQEFPHPPLPLLRNETLVREVTDQDFLTGDFTREAVEFIEKNRRRPFFLYLPHSMVHGPLAAGKEWRGRSGKGLYEDSVAEIDGSVGRILETLERLGLKENTLVLFLSDNGGTPRAVNRPLRGGKGTTWEGGVRVPAIAWWPGRIGKGRVTDEIASNMDLLPTLTRLAGGEVPGGLQIDGHDLRPVFENWPGGARRYEEFRFYHANKLWAVREGKWKLHASGELYDLAADIGESRDVAGENPAVVARLRARLEAARADLGDGTHEGKNVRMMGRAKGPLRFWIPRHAGSGYPPQAPVKRVPGAPYGAE
jgi:arylsulfatase A-like enzyme